jgi:hypothetical protein
VLLRCQQELHTQGFLLVPTGKNQEISSLASVDAMQWVLLYPSIVHDRGSLEHIAQERYNVPEHDHACTMFVF